VLIFLVSCAALILVSYMTAPPSPKQLSGLTYATVTPEQRRISRASWNHWDLVTSGVVLALILAAYIYFNG
jgi:SSS family solute:Na+ symporter